MHIEILRYTLLKKNKKIFQVDQLFNDKSIWSKISILVGRKRNKLIVIIEKATLCAMMAKI